MKKKSEEGVCGEGRKKILLGYRRRRGVGRIGGDILPLPFLFFRGLD